MIVICLTGVLFLINKYILQKIKLWKKHRWRAWDLNYFGLLDGRADINFELWCTNIDLSTAIYEYATHLDLLIVL